MRTVTAAWRDAMTDVNARLVEVVTITTPVAGETYQFSDANPPVFGYPSLIHQISERAQRFNLLGFETSIAEWTIAFANDPALRHIFATERLMNSIVRHYLGTASLALEDFMLVGTGRVASRPICTGTLIELPVNGVLARLAEVEFERFSFENWHPLEAAWHIIASAVGTDNVDVDSFDRNADQWADWLHYNLSSPYDWHGKAAMMSVFNEAQKILQMVAGVITETPDGLVRALSYAADRSIVRKIPAEDIIALRQARADNGYTRLRFEGGKKPDALTPQDWLLEMSSGYGAGGFLGAIWFDNWPESPFRIANDNLYLQAIYQMDGVDYIREKTLRNDYFQAFANHGTEHSAADFLEAWGLPVWGNDLLLIHGAGWRGFTGMGLISPDLEAEPPESWTIRANGEVSEARPAFIGVFRSLVTEAPNAPQLYSPKIYRVTRMEPVSIPGDWPATTGVLPFGYGPQAATTSWAHVLYQFTDGREVTIDVPVEDWTLSISRGLFPGVVHCQYESIENAVPPPGYEEEPSRAEYGGEVVDFTPWINLLRLLGARISDGSVIVEVEASIRHMDLEMLDRVVLNDDRVLGYGLNGVGDADVFEVLQVERRGKHACLLLAYVPPEEEPWMTDQRIRVPSITRPGDVSINAAVLTSTGDAVIDENDVAVWTGGG